MKYRRKEYKDNDFVKIRDFLQESRVYSQQNWFIERWNFCRYFTQVKLGTYSAWPETVGIWIDENDKIVAVANSEGENRGEAFFQLGNIEYSDELILEMLEFTEEKLSVVENNERKIFLRMDVDRSSQIKELLKKREYELLKDWTEIGSAMNIKDDLPVVLPEGFRIVDANEVNEDQKGLAFGRAFMDTDSANFEGLEERVKAYRSMRSAPDYRPELYLSIVNQSNEIVSFATVWLDRENQLGIFEPVGTVPKFRRKGLGKAILYDAMNRLKSLGCKKMHVGSDQEFYLDIGFSLDNSFDEVWFKKL